MKILKINYWYWIVVMTKFTSPLEEYVTKNLKHMVLLQRFHLWPGLTFSWKWVNVKIHPSVIIREKS